MSDLRRLPSIEQILQIPEVRAWIEFYGRPLTLSAARYVLDEVRRRYPQTGVVPTQFELLGEIEQFLKERTTPTLHEVINATGVILHTNLGRAPLSRNALQAIHEVAIGYASLEFDLASGRRGSRSIHCEGLLKDLTGAEAALVVNNNAAAVLLVLTALARRRPVVIARSQLVEIGGGFRVPDVMKQSGARLVEIGTTNRVHLKDYIEAIEETAPALVMRAHRSNFRMIGFTSEPSLAEIIAVAHQADIPVVDDLGSGALLDTAEFGLAHEPMVQESLAAGADIVCFSGDKLLGGPQAGIILGRGELINRLKKHPLARAVRADKLCLAGLQETLLHYLKDEALREIPVWKMISTSLEQIESRARGWIAELGQGEILSGLSTVGGGSLPGETLPTFLVALNHPKPIRLITSLRNSRPPIIARLQDDRIVLDPRTVLDEQDSTLLQALKLMLTDTP